CFQVIAPAAGMTCAPAATPAPNAERKSCPAPPETLFHALQSLVKGLLSFAEREAHERSAIGRIVIERTGWNGCDADALNEVSAERHIAVESEGRVIDHDKVRSIGRKNGEPQFRQ